MKPLLAAALGLGLGLGLVFGAPGARADTVRLKSGEVHEGTIVEEDSERIVLQAGSFKLTFYHSDIESVDRKPRPRPAPPPPAPTPAAVPQTPFEMLRSADESTREQGARKLLAQGATMVPAGLDDLGRADLPPPGRALLCRVLGQSQDRRVLGPLIDSLAHPAPEVRAAAALGLADLNLLDARPALETVAKDDKEPEPRRRATVALTRLASLESAPLLADLLVEKDWVLRSTASRALGRMLKPPIPDKVMARIRKALEAKDTGPRLEALAVLSAVADPATAPLVMEAARTDAAAQVRGAAVSGLGGFKDNETSGAILRSIREDAALDVRRQAALAAKRRKIRTAIEPLIDSLRESDTRFKRAIAEVLAALTGERLPPSHHAWLDWWIREGRGRFGGA